VLLLLQVDDQLAELFLSEEPIDAEQLAAAIRRATLANKFAPVFMGSAYKNKGGCLCTYMQWVLVYNICNGMYVGCRFTSCECTALLTVQMVAGGGELWIHMRPMLFCLGNGRY
jgi:hypothetical protein